MTNKTIKRMWAPIALVALLLATIFLSTSASAAGTSGGTSAGTSGQVNAVYVSIDDPNLIQDLNNKKYKDATLVIGFTEQDHIVSETLYKALESASATNTAIPYWFRSQDLGVVSSSNATDVVENYVEWKFPAGYNLANFNLGVTAKSADKVTDANFTSIANAVKADKAVFLDFAYSGTLEKPVEINYVEKITNGTTRKATYLDYKNVDVYYCPANTLTIESVQTGVSFKDGVQFPGYTFTVSHMSTYMLKIGSYAGPTSNTNGGTTANNNNNTNSSKSSTSTSGSSSSSTSGDSAGVNPSTGSADAIVASSAAFLLASCSAVVALRKKK